MMPLMVTKVLIHPGSNDDDKNAVGDAATAAFGANVMGS